MSRESQAIEMEMDEDGVFKPVKRRKTRVQKSSSRKTKYSEDEGEFEKEEIIQKPRQPIPRVRPPQRAVALRQSRAAEDFLGGFEAGMEVLGKMEKLISKWCR